MRDRRLRIAPMLLALVLARPAAAQDRKCHVLCAPVFTFQPSLGISNWFNPPTVRRLSDDAVFKLDTKTEFTMRFVTTFATAIPRISLEAALEWTPYAGAGTDVNPLTGRQVDEEVKDNAADLSFVLIIDMITTKQTGGWFGASADAVLFFDPAEKPDDKSFYTFKVGPELAITFNLFNFLPRSYWLRNVSLFGLLDYVATGIPETGDIVAGLEYLDNADHWDILVGLVIPLAPFPR